MIRGYVHFQHSGVSKATQVDPGTAAAKVRYASRGSACVAVATSGAIPADRAKAIRWFNDREAGLRKNGRVAEALILGLPHQATDTERKALVHRFLTATGMESYYAAYHRGEPGSPLNEHVHVLGVATGWNAGGATKLLRSAWCAILNEWGLPRGIEFHPGTLVEQRAEALARGDHALADELNRPAPVHIGPELKAIAEKQPLTPRGRRKLEQHADDKARLATKRLVRGRGRDQAKAKAQQPAAPEPLPTASAPMAMGAPLELGAPAPKFFEELSQDFEVRHPIGDLPTGEAAEILGQGLAELRHLQKHQNLRKALQEYLSPWPPGSQSAMLEMRLNRRPAFNVKIAVTWVCGRLGHVDSQVAFDEWTFLERALEELEQKTHDPRRDIPVP